MTNLEKPRLKSKDITLPTKVCIVKTMVFPVIMHRCESWTRKKAEHQRIDAFELQCWRRLWRVPWTARSSNQSILKEINPEYSLEELMLKLQNLGHLMWSADSLEKTMMLGKTEGKRRRWHWMRQLDGITDSVDIWANSQRQWRRGKPGMLQSTGLQKVGHSLANEQLYPLNNSPFSPPSNPGQPLFHSLFLRVWLLWLLV